MSQGLTGAVSGAATRAASTASATTVTLPAAPLVAIYPISGTTTITSITAGQAGKIAILEFASAACQVTNGSNLKLAGANFISTVLRTLTLESDGTNWVEVARGEFGTTTPSTQAFGDAAAHGTSGESADASHKHAMPSDPNAVTTAIHGLPASVAVLGNRTASGEFIQHATASVTYGTGSALSLTTWHQVAVTFPVAFTAAPIVLLGGGDQANGSPGVAIAVTTTGFTIRVWDNQGSSFAGSFGYVALGT